MKKMLRIRRPKHQAWAYLDGEPPDGEAVNAVAGRDLLERLIVGRHVSGVELRGATVPDVAAEVCEPDLLEDAADKHHDLLGD
jgi:hypothetical protein